MTTSSAGTTSAPLANRLALSSPSASAPLAGRVPVPSETVRYVRSETVDGGELHVSVAAVDFDQGTVDSPWSAPHSASVAEEVCSHLPLLFLTPAGL